jgi:hypothetical protein
MSRYRQTDNLSASDHESGLLVMGQAIRVLHDLLALFAYWKPWLVLLLA